MTLPVFVNKHRLILLSLASGLLLAASWPARGLPVLAFVALLPLLMVESQMFGERSHRRSVDFFMHAWLAFFVWNLFTTWWIVFATIPGMITAVVLNSFFMAIPWWLMHVWRRMLPKRQGVLPVVFFWLSFEFLHSKWDLSWNWLDLGNVFAAWPSWVQWYEFTGTSGGAIWVLLVNILLYMLVKELRSPGAKAKRVRWFGVLTATAFAVPLVLSLTMHARYAEKPNPVEVVIVQPSYDPYQPAQTPTEAMQRVETMVALAKEALSPHTRFVALPEAAMPDGIWLHQTGQNRGVLQVREFLFQNPQLSWVSGSFTYQLYENGQEASLTARSVSGTSNSYDVYNSAVFIGQQGSFDFYHKSKLVPGIERMPFFTVLKPIGRLVSALGGTAGSMGTQPHRGVFRAAPGEPVVAPVICYESIYGDFMSEYARRGAGIIFVLTNDGWWRKTPGHRQHHEYARLRAIELRKPVVRAASTGISSFIDQRGQVIKKTEWWQQTAIRESVNQNYRLTYYALQGNVAGKISVFFSALLLLAMISRRYINRKD
ncbi:MAG: apolipoprotein N-acyltransferase [Bacteroidales bacterium]|nr:apolipoprotein N-acyltransferase [Bacteroidales bacterium]